MTTGTRIARSIDRFNGYINVTSAYLAEGTPICCKEKKKV